MKLSEIENAELSSAICYIIGLIYPLTKEKDYGNHKYIIGSINHNVDMITDEELAAHFHTILNLFQNENIDTDCLKNNKSRDFGFSISAKKGFSVVIDATGYTSKKIQEVLTGKVRKIKESANEYKKEFAKGCFDGRASWDTTAKYFSVDVDRNHPKQDLIESIFNDFDIELNKNQRVIDHPKNDQLRIKPTSIEKYFDEIGTYSLARRKILENGIKTL